MADEGLASGMINLSRALGGVFAVAFLGALLSGTLASNITTALVPLNLPASVVHRVASATHHGSAWALLAAPPPGVSAAVLRPAVDAAFTSGMHVAAIGGAAFAIMLTVLFALASPRRRLRAAVKATTLGSPAHGPAA